MGRRDTEHLEHGFSVFFVAESGALASPYTPPSMRIEALFTPYRSAPMAADAEKNRSKGLVNLELEAYVHIPPVGVNLGPRYWKCICRGGVVWKLFETKR